MMNKKTVRDINVNNKKVLVRLDLNVPFDDKKNITDETRITAVLPTLKYLIEHNAKVVVMSHAGRPKGKFDSNFSLKPVAGRLGELLGVKVSCADDVVGESARNLVANIKSGEVVVLENVRFHKEETENDDSFARELSQFGEVFVNDAFGTAHRAHASTAGVAKYIPAVAGFLMEKELKFLSGVLDDPKRPVVAIFGGAKVSDKIGIIGNFINKLESGDTIIIGGGMAYTFAKALGGKVGKSIIDQDQLPNVTKYIDKAHENGINFILPVDTVAGDEFKPDANFCDCPMNEVPDNFLGMDIGDESVATFRDFIADAGTVLWNGPMGVFEFEKTSRGTNEVAEAVCEATQRGAVSVVGGGDSVAAIGKLGLKDKITHISTGGGASLQLLEGKKMPGIDALENLK